MESLNSVAVVYSLPPQRLLATKYSATDEDSAVIAAKVKEGLEVRGYRATLYPISEDSIEDILAIKADCIFNLIEWCGEDIHLSEKAFSYLRQLDIPVTGSCEEIFVLTGDKIRMKQELQKHDISTPQGQAFTTGSEDIPSNLPFPMIVKPSLEHCSIGLSRESIAHDEFELRTITRRQIETFNQPVLAEEFIAGRELLVYLLEENGSVRVLPIEEIIFAGNDPSSFQTYATKWETDNPEYQTTDVMIAKLSDDEQKIVESLCITAFRKMRLWGYSRFDVRFRKNIPYILETNANPSVYDSDNEDQAIEDEVIWGIKFPDYLDMIVKSALHHYSLGERV